MTTRWAWLLLGMGLTWASILINGLAWWVLVAWLGHPPADVALVPLFVRSNLLKYLPGGVWHLLERVRVLRGSIGAGRPGDGDSRSTAHRGRVAVAVAPPGLAGGSMLLAPLPALLMLPRWRSCRCGDWNVARPSSCAARPMKISQRFHREAGAVTTPWVPLAAQLIRVHPVRRFSVLRAGVSTAAVLADGLASRLRSGLRRRSGGARCTRRIGIFEATLQLVSRQHCAGGSTAGGCSQLQGDLHTGGRPCCVGGCCGSVPDATVAA